MPNNFVVPASPEFRNLWNYFAHVRYIVTPHHTRDFVTSFCIADDTLSILSNTLGFRYSIEENEAWNDLYVVIFWDQNPISRDSLNHSDVCDILNELRDVLCNRSINIQASDFLAEALSQIDESDSEFKDWKFLDE